MISTADAHTIDSLLPETLLAYRLADYAIDAPGGELVLRIHEPSAELAVLMRARGARTAAFLTACNPASRPQPDAENRRAQRALQAELDALGCRWLPGAGRDPAGRWQAEPSVLALDLSLPEARTIAARHGQSAFVWIASSDGLPTLRLLAPLRLPQPAELAAWAASLPADEAAAAGRLDAREAALLMSVPDEERRHWLLPANRDLAKTWPVARPDGVVTHAGTELDRQFRLMAAGLGPMLDPG